MFYFPPTRLKDPTKVGLENRDLNTIEATVRQTSRVLEANTLDANCCCGANYKNSLAKK